MQKVLQLSSILAAKGTKNLLWSARLQTSSYKNSSYW